MSDGDGPLDADALYEAALRAQQSEPGARPAGGAPRAVVATPVRPDPRPGATARSRSAVAPATAVVLDTTPPANGASSGATVANRGPGVEPGADRPGGGESAKAAPPRGWFWRWGFPVLVLALALLVPVLVVAGQRVILSSSEGVLLTEVTDPAAPGWQAVTDLTPTLLVVQTDEAGAVDGLTLLTLTGEGYGGAVFIPVDTVATTADGTTAPLAAIATRGVDELQLAVELLLGTSIGESVVVDPTQWADLVGPVAPLPVDNPDPVTEVDEAGVERIVFPQGRIQLPATQVAAYLGTPNPDESELNRLVRHEAFWRAWLQRVGVSDDAAVVPGEVDTGLGRFVRQLASDQVTFAPLPVQPAGIPGSDEAVFLPVTDQVQGLVSRIVPFPSSPLPGGRVRVLVLDGTGQLGHGLGAVPALVAADAQVEQVGNAGAFGVATTEVRIAGPEHADAAAAFVDALGLGTVLEVDDVPPAVDVVVVLGADYLAAAGPVTSTTVAPPDPAGGGGG